MSRPRSAQPSPFSAIGRMCGTREPLPRYYFDASLLFRCMDRLQIDRRELAADDPLLFRELQGICTLCPDKEQCVRELATEFDNARWDEWWSYCPNAAMLTVIGALQNCGRAALRLDVGKVSSLLHLH